MYKFLRNKKSPLRNYTTSFSKLEEFITNSVSKLQSSSKQPTNNEVKVLREPSDDDESSKEQSRTVQISHPWPEWVDLIHCLFKNGYFEEQSQHINSVFNGKDVNHIRTACLNFARDRRQLIRYLSRKDIHVISGCGCPSTDRKVVNSAKRLRAHVKIDEGNVCSCCSLRGNCNRAYVKPREDEGGRTVDVMRILLTYGLAPIADSVENKSCLNKMTKDSVRILLKEMVGYSSVRLESDQHETGSSESKLSPLDHLSEYGKGRIKVPMKQGDWRCPKCNFLNFARNIKCLHCNVYSEEKIIRIREDQEHLPRKKGDWICDKCSFLNFAKNTKCLLCNEKPSNRHLNPGEWECESCNYVNFRSNMVCLKCDHRRQKATNTCVIPTQPESVANHKSSRFTFTTVEHEIINNDCTEKETHEQQKYTKDDSGFVDFPILGGKSELSRDAQKRESWKLEMLAMNNKEGREEETSDDLSTIQRRAYFLESSDDEDMADWFGNGKFKGMME